MLQFNDIHGYVITTKPTEHFMWDLDSNKRNLARVAFQLCNSVTIVSLCVHNDDELHILIFMT